MSEAVDFLDLEEVDELSIDQLYQVVEGQLDGEDKGALIPPGSHNEARNWVYAYQKINSEVDRLKDEYIPYLIARYVDPVKKKIERHKQAQDIIKEGLREFLENIEETRANFPDLGTVYIQKGSEKIVYPEDEDALAESLYKIKSEFVKMSLSLDKNKIKSAYKENGEIPIPELSVEKSEPEVRVRKAKV